MPIENKYALVNGNQVHNMFAEWLIGQIALYNACMFIAALLLKNLYEKVHKHFCCTGIFNPFAAQRPGVQVSDTCLPAGRQRKATIAVQLVHKKYGKHNALIA